MGHDGMHFLTMQERQFKSQTQTVKQTLVGCSEIEQCGGGDIEKEKGQ